MIGLTDSKTQIDVLLDSMAQEIQLDASRWKRMQNHYEAVKDWIESDEAFFKPYKYDVYPHGSVRTLTTVKPLAKEEFDLDIAIHLLPNSDRHTPAKIYTELKRRMLEHATYKPMVEAKNRCIRLNYSGDFHMDILPGIQENPADQNKLKVPDRELGTWVSSNPRGYAEWFINQASSVQVSLLEKAMNAEMLPSDEYKEKKPLQRAVQLIKRYRDIYFQDDDSYKTSSIILTTIAGQFYNYADSIFDTIDHIITEIVRQVGTNPARIKVRNPVNPAEDFTDKWDQDAGYYTAFKGFAQHLYKEWQALKREQGVIKEAAIFKGLFGEELLNKAQVQRTEFLENYRSQNRLGINKKSGIIGGLGTTKGAVIKTNTFFGESE